MLGNRARTAPVHRSAFNSGSYLNPVPGVPARLLILQVLRRTMTSGGFRGGYMSKPQDRGLTHCMANLPLCGPHTGRPYLQMTSAVCVCVCVLYSRWRRE